MGGNFLSIFIACFTISFIGSASAEPEAGGFHDELTAISTGSFSTLQHAIENPGYGVAEAEIVEIWPGQADDEIWFYQEQAFLGETPETIDPAMKARPYFARVIRSVETEPGIVRRSVYKLKKPEMAAGRWKDAAPLERLSPEDLRPSECDITFIRIAHNFWRSESQKCPNLYKGAEYAISLGVVTSGAYANWDRGFDANGSVVWGPKKGGYVFQRKN